MEVWLAPHIVGAPQYVVADLDTGKLRSSKEPDPDAWVLGGGVKDLSALMKLSGLESTFPDEPHIKAMATLGAQPHEVPWWRVIPGTRYRELLHELLGDVRRALNGDDIGYYTKVFEPSRRLLRSLARAKVDEGNWWKFIDAGGGNLPALKTCAPMNDGFMKQAKYDQMSTRTGRLVISDGPNILTLRKDHRQVIQSRWEGGQILMLDYMSLEARIAANEAGLRLGDDIYTDIGTQVLGGVPRQVAKVAVLATIYGGGARMLSEFVEPGSADWLVDRLRDYFKVSKLTSKLRNQHEANEGYIRNFYGRRVESLPADHILYNSYVQSTGVDAALLGFAKISCYIEESGLKSQPLFVLHDALILDIHPDEKMYVPMMEKYGSDIDDFDIKFPVSVTDIREAI